MLCFANLILKNYIIRRKKLDVILVCSFYLQQHPSWHGSDLSQYDLSKFQWVFCGHQWKFFDMLTASVTHLLVW